jgi:hypothetical protein
MVPSLDSQTRKRLKSFLDVTTNIVVVLFAVVAIGVLVKNYFAPQSPKNSVTIKKGSVFPEIAGVDLDKLGIHSTPTLILVDSSGKVLDSWSGELQPDAEREVFAALGLPYKPKTGSTSTGANVKKTADIFDEQKTAFSIRPQAEVAFTRIVQVKDRRVAAQPVALAQSSDCYLSNMKLSILRLDRTRIVRSVECLSERAVVKRVNVNFVIVDVRDVEEFFS